jgi:hypothetical protein
MGKANRLFNGAGHRTLHNRVTPTPGQLEFLRIQWNALADHLKLQLSSKYGYTVSSWLQGSYKYGTLIRPVNLGEEYDVDVGIYFSWVPDGSAAPAPEQLREWVQRELDNYKKICADVKEISKPPKERCSRAIFSNHFHIDTPVYHLNPSNDKRRLACLSRTWEESDPKAIYKWFRAAARGEEREQLRRLIRYLKGWAAVAFKESPGSRPSSILLTVLVTQAYQDMWLVRLGDLDDEDALIQVIKRIHGRLYRSSVVPNPVDDGENLNRINEENWPSFLTSLHALCLTAENAEDAADEITAALAWSEPFSYLFPLPDALEVEIVDLKSEQAVMQLPEIEIEVFGNTPKQPLKRYRNEVTSVAKGCDLIFTIANPHVIPEYATVEWTVRNDGEESDSLGDIGHRTMGTRMLKTKERATYQGRHYMDCVIRLFGQIYSVRRVPVHVKDIRYPDRNPPKPAYTKIKSFWRRRR